MTWRVLAFLLALLGPAAAQTIPAGEAVLNQGLASAAVTPSNTVFLIPTRFIFIGQATACNVALRLDRDSAAVTWTDVQAGEILPVAAIQVLSTGTTCTGIVAVW